ncbi:MAG TPA: DUF1800 domain-containing protein [Plasticicumulans sp.]|nr:DUF1800 domain-containing protein [Plasticicumulans sp.]
MSRSLLCSVLLTGWLLLPPAAAAAPAPAPLSDAERTLHVLDRLAYGPRPGELDAVAAEGTDAWIARQLQPDSLPLPPALLAELEALPTHGLDAAEIWRRYGPPAQAALPVKERPLAEAKAKRLVLAAEQRERLLRALASPRQLEEVMTEFWFDHFNVHREKDAVMLWVGDYERSAIRPHALGRFRELLGATARHPAMLYYLDNWRSGAGGQNENYARELLELHTLGADGGYTQADVIALARILSGWTLDLAGAAEPGAPLFRFQPGRHAGGDKRLLGQRIPAGGEDEGEAALDLLARHPSTARHIAYELAQRFVADQPPKPLVALLAKRFRDTDGDLRAVLATLFESPQFTARAAWRAKFKTPYRYVLSAWRAGQLPIDDTAPVMTALDRLGQPLWGCPTPDGYGDTAADWLGPDALRLRVDLATAWASGRLPGRDAGPDKSGRRRDAGRMSPPAAGEASMAPMAPMNPSAMAAAGADREAGSEPPEAAPAMAMTPPMRSPAEAAVRRSGPVPADPALAPDAASLAATLGPGIGRRTAAAVASASPPLRSVLLLGGPDFMRR